MSEAPCEEGCTALPSQPPYEDADYVQPWKPSWEGRISALYPNTSVPSWLSVSLADGSASWGGADSSKGASLPAPLVPLHTIQLILQNRSCSGKSFVLFTTGTERCHLLLALLSETAGSFF